ncbi:hypothetical protein ENBRE01_2871, partial [Enteropsectra breve]
PRPNNDERVFISEKLSLSHEKIKNWFQNRRAKERRDVLDGPCLEFNNPIQEYKQSLLLFPDCSDLFTRRENRK